MNARFVFVQGTLLQIGFECSKVYGEGNKKLFEGSPTSTRSLQIRGLRSPWVGLPHRARPVRALLSQGVDSCHSGTRAP